MARIRTIKPEFCSSADVGALSREARLFFLQLLTEADDEGRLLWIPRRLCGVLYPFDNDITPDHLNTWAQQCEARGMVVRYVAADITYLAIVHWGKHQKISHPTASKFPPPLDQLGAAPESFRNGSGEAPETLRPEQGTGNRELEQGIGSGSPAGDPPPAKPICIKNAKAERIAQVTGEAIAAFNATLGKPNGLLAAVKLENDVRRKQVKRCISVAREICMRQWNSPTITPEFWRAYFEECSRDPFKNGEGPYSGSHANWRPDFEYLTRDEVMTSVFDRAMSEQAA